MRHVSPFLIAIIAGFSLLAHGVETNVIVIPKGDNRAGAIFFVDECLTKGLTNSISLVELRKWATNTMRLYREKESLLVKQRFFSVFTADVPDTIRSIQTRIPACRSAKSATTKTDEWEQFIETYGKAWAVSKEEAEQWLRTKWPDRDPPKVGFSRSSEGVIEAVTISWYGYGVIVGPEQFKPTWEHAPWYHRKLGDGVYLVHGYK